MQKTTFTITSNLEGTLERSIVSYQMNLLSISNQDIQNIVSYNLRPGASTPRKTSHNFDYTNERVGTMVESRYNF